MVKTKNNNKLKISFAIVGCSLLTAGGGIGLGYLIFNKPSSTLPEHVPTINLVKRSGNEVLSKANDTVIWDLQSSLPLKNFTGSSSNITSGVEEYIDWNDGVSAPTADSLDDAPDNKSGIFWNDANDISQGIYVQIILLKDYAGIQGEDETIFKELDITTKLHDNSGKYADVECVNSVALVDDNESPEQVISPNIVKNVATNNISGVAMTASTTPDDVLSYFGDNIINDTVEFDGTDNWVKENITAAQVACLLMLDTLELWKHALGQTFISRDQSVILSTVGWNITLRINSVEKTSSINNSFNVSFEQDLRDESGQIISPQYLDVSGLSGYQYLNLDIPSAIYTANGANLLNYVTGDMNGTDEQRKTITHLGGATSSTSISLHGDETNPLTGNLNALWYYPVSSSRGGKNLQTDFTYNDIADAFWPGLHV